MQSLKMHSFYNQLWIKYFTLNKQEREFKVPPYFSFLFLKHQEKCSKLKGAPLQIKIKYAIYTLNMLCSLFGWNRGQISGVGNEEVSTNKESYRKKGSEYSKSLPKPFIF